jgi:hypothetical protein
LTDRIYKLSRWLTARYGERVFKVSLRGGFTCPNRDGTRGTNGCSFCAGDRFVPTGYQSGMDIAAQLAHGLRYLERRHGAERAIAFFHDYSATYAPPARLRELYAPALEHPAVVGLAVSTRPDCLGEDVLDLLEDTARNKDLWVELGLQIADDGLLEGLGRGHTVAEFRGAVSACASRGLPVCAHVIVGLPGATPEQEIRTAALLAELGVWGVKIHAFHVIRSTPMERAHRDGNAPVLALGEYVARVVNVLEHLPADTVIHRLTGETSRRLTVAPDWSVNKMVAYDAILAALVERDTRQGALLAVTQSS